MYIMIGNKFTDSKTDAVTMTNIDNRTFKMKYFSLFYDKRLQNYWPSKFKLEMSNL